MLVVSKLWSEMML